jgi:ABC-type branched-subunit amino acid transport system substrate-binding protein
MTKADAVGSATSVGTVRPGGAKPPIGKIALGVAAVAVLAAAGFGASKLFIKEPPLEPEVNVEPLDPQQQGGATQPQGGATQAPGNTASGAGNAALPIANCQQIDPDDLVSTCADKTLVNLFSQGERVLLTGTSNFENKEQAATKFMLADWDAAVTWYDKALSADPNDPEAQIYFNNAKAMQTGNPLVIGAVIPIPLDTDTGKEILRGVATAQKKYNDSNVERLLSVVIVDSSGATPENTLEGQLASVLMGAKQVLGVIGHGADQYSAAILQGYAAQSVPVLAPMTIELKDPVGSGNSTLRTVPIAQGVDDLYKQYVIKALGTLIDHAKTVKSEAKVTIVFDSTNPYSNYIKEQFETNEASLAAPGTLLKSIDIGSERNLDGASIVNTAKSNGSNSLLLALPGDTGVAIAISVAQSNTALGAGKLLLMGDAALYSPQLLINGDAAVNDMVLAVPWRWDENDPDFSKETASLWQGRVSWRTTAAYDVTDLFTRVLSRTPDRTEAFNLLQQGVEVGATQADYNVINSVPLVCVQPNPSAGPSGANFGFVPVEQGCL